VCVCVCVCTRQGTARQHRPLHTTNVQHNPTRCGPTPQPPGKHHINILCMCICVYFRLCGDSLNDIVHTCILYKCMCVLAPMRG
jgi:hypothetical protein